MSMAINPFVFAPPVGGAAAFGTNENLVEQDTTGTELTGASISTTLDASTDYLFFWSVDVQTSSTSSAAIADVEIGGVSVFTAAQPTIIPKEVTSPLDYQTMGGFFRYQEGGAPALTAYTNKGKRGNAATLRIRNSRLSYLKIGPNDEFAESISRQTFADPTNKTAQTAASLNFTPATTGDYIILAFCNVDLTNATNTQYGFELTDGTTTTGEILMRPLATNDRCPTMLMIRLAGASGAKTVNLKVRQTGTGTTTIGISEIRMVAIREDRFNNVYWSGLLSADSAGTEGTYTTAHSQAFTPAATDHLTIAAWQMGSTSTSVSAYSQYLDDADTVNEYIREFGVGIADSGLGGVSHRVAAYPATSRTQAIQRRSEAAANNQVQTSAAIVTFSLAGF